jgi:glutathione S-transferase
VARYLNSPVEYLRASPRDPNNEQAFRAINPNRLVPVLVEDERRLWETDAIACRLSSLANSDFWRTGEDMAEMIMWVSWGSNHLNRAAGDLYFDRLIRPTFSDQGADPRLVEEALSDFRSHAATLDAQLKDRTWLVGDHMSYADLRVASALPFSEAAGLPLDEFPNVRLWHERPCEFDAWRAPFEGLA